MLNDKRVRGFVFEAPAESVTIRNIKLLDFFFYAPPGSPTWKRIRLIKIVTGFLVLLLTAAWPFVFLTLDPSQPGAFAIELTVAILSVFQAGVVLSFSNYDVLRLRVTSAVFLLDLFSVVVLVGLVTLFGEGFVLFGGIYFAASLIMAYIAEPTEVDGRLNTRQNSIILKRMKYFVYFCGSVGVMMFRVCIFFKQITVSNDIVLIRNDFSGEAVTVRDLWEFLVDISVLRYIYITAGRFAKPTDTITLPRRPARLKELP